MVEKTIRRGGEEVAGSTSPLTKGKEEERDTHTCKRIIYDDLARQLYVTHR